MSRVFRYSLLGVLALLLLLLLAVGLLLGTQAGSRWALGLVPGLQLENFQGRLAGQWQADRLLWEQGADRVELLAPVFAWSPHCLLRMTLCIERLQADQVNLAFAPGEPSTDSGPLQLPGLKLPLAIELGEVRIGHLRLDGNEQLSQLQLAAHWTVAGLQIDSLQLQRDDLHLSLQGLIQPEGGWPLQLKGQLQLPKVDGQDWQLALQIDGELQKTLKLTGDSSGYLNARLKGELQALAEQLPATLQISAQAFKPGAELPDTLQLNNLELSAKGNLQSGYQL
ncbi:MAG: translocation/assembly module TamB, partial [Pseudomonas sp.]